LNLGAFNYLTKPFERTQLKKVISRGFEIYDQENTRKQDLQQRLMGVHDSFFALLCHEFNTPLNVIMGFSELLAKGVENPEQASWAQHVKESGSHLHDILMEIVDYIAASHLAAAGVEKVFAPSVLLQPMIDALAERNVTVELDDRLCGSSPGLPRSARTGFALRPALKCAMGRIFTCPLSARASAAIPLPAGESMNSSSLTIFRRSAGLPRR
jgi:signal transduction histidine kinase